MMTRYRIKKIIGLVVFLCIIGNIFTGITYMYRNNNWEQQHINGIKYEDKLDVVCIGGSSTFVYWEPFLAWNEYGMTSYDFATDSARPAITKGYVREAIDRVNPDLIVIDMRCYAEGAVETEDFEGAEYGIRNMTDSMDLNLNRLLTINDVMDYYDAFNDDSTDPWSFYFDIVKYHTKDNKLGDGDSWRHFFNGNYKSEYKGFEFIEDDNHDFINEPIDYETDEAGELDLSIEESLIDLLEYLKGNNINTLFVAGPIPVDKETQTKYNRIGQLVESYDYKFLNTNNHYDEMGIDFSKDFYNEGHVNVYGAEKYTRFVADYIKANYNLEDHRADTAYSEWDEYYNNAHEQDLLTKGTIDKAIEEKNQAYEKGKELKNINSIYEWTKDANNSNYTIIAVSKGEVPDVLVPWNISSGSEDIIRVYDSDTAIIEFDSEQDEDCNIEIGKHSIPAIINSGDNAKVIIADEEIPMVDEGLYIIVFDNNYNEILDCVNIAGALEMSHIDF